MLALLAATPVSGEPLPPGLVSMPDLAPGFEAMPRLEARTTAANRINDDLAAIDRRALAASDDCRASPKSDWARWIVVRSAGPGLLSVSERHDFYCDGASHPNHHHVDYTYDLATGEPVDWASLLPLALAMEPGGDGPWHRPDARSYRSPALAELYATHLSAPPAADCAGFAEDPHLGFTFAPSAIDRGLAMTPTGYAYVLTPCADEALIPVETLRALGAAPLLVEALRTDRP